MARILAIEWDAREARAVVARTRADDVTVEDAFVIDVTPRAGQETLSDEEVGARILSALSARNISKLETHVSVGRANIELRFLNVPPAPEEELPGMVRLQAGRHFSNLGADSTLDFVPVGQAEDGSLNLLGAATSAEFLRDVQQTCSAAQLTPQSIVLRPFATASLWRRSNDVTPCTLMIDVLGNEADLTVLVDGNVVVTRTVRLPDDPAAIAAALIGEVKRTSAAAQNQTSGRKVDGIVLLGDVSEFGDAQETLSQALEIPVAFFNPFTNLKFAEGWRAPGRSGRFAPLLGMILDESAGERHLVDFLNPRRKPEAASYNRRQAMVGGGVAALALLVLVILWLQFRALDQRIEQLTQESASWDPLVKKAQQLTRDVHEIEQFQDANVRWLDELRLMSEVAPPAEDMIVRQWTSAARKEGGGVIAIEGQAEEFSTIEQLERALRDPRHQVFGRGGREDEKADAYRWVFNEEIVVSSSSSADGAEETP